jgi:hypothetical protein
MENAGDVNSAAVSSKAGISFYAIAALVFAIFSLLSPFVIFVEMFTGLLAVILAVISISKIKANPGQKGKIIAIISMVLGVLAVILGIGSLLYFQAFSPEPPSGFSLDTPEDIECRTTCIDNHETNLYAINYQSNKCECLVDSITVGSYDI